MTHPTDLKLNVPSQAARKVVGGSLLTAGLLVGAGIVILGGDAPLDASTAQPSQLATIDAAAINLSTPERNAIDLTAIPDQASAWNAEPLTTPEVENAHFEATPDELANPPIEWVRNPTAKQASRPVGIDLTPNQFEPIWLTGRVTPIQD